MKFLLRILLMLGFFFLLGFYFGDFNIGFINVKQKFRSACECRILLDLEDLYYDWTRPARR